MVIGDDLIRMYVRSSGWVIGHRHMFDWCTIAADEGISRWVLVYGRYNWLECEGKEKLELSNESQSN